MRTSVRSIVEGRTSFRTLSFQNLISRFVMMRASAILMFLFITGTSLVAQQTNRTITSGGTWSSSTTAIWSGGNRADALNEDVTMNNDLAGGGGVVTLQTSYTVGNINTGDDNNLVIDDNITLNVGQSGSAMNINVGDNTVITVDAGGNLTIWGSINVGDDEELTLNVTGSVTVKGDVNINEGGTLTVNGSGPFIVEGDLDGGDEDDINLNINGDMTVYGDFEMGDGLDFDVDGALAVWGSFYVEEDMDMTVAGTVAVGGNFDSEENTDITIDSTGNFSVGGNFETEEDFDLIGNGAIAIGGGFSFNIDDPDGDGVNMTINGPFEVGGDFNSDEIDDLDFIVGSTGDVLIGNNFIVDDGLDLQIAAGGYMEVTEDFIGDDDADLNPIAGGLVIGNDITVDVNSSIVETGSGYVVYGGTCSGPAGFCANASFPITLLYFEANSTDETVVLSWATTMEDNFEKFVVEHSVDGTSFLPIGEVMSTGINKIDIQTDYSFVDKVPSIGTNYYRLRAVDLDGSFEYYPIIAIKFAGNYALHIFSNPSDGKSIRYKINFKPSASDQITICDPVGSEVISISVSKREDRVELQNPLSPGIYLVKYKGARFTTLQRLMVR